MIDMMISMRMSWTHTSVFQGRKCSIGIAHGRNKYGSASVYSMPDFVFWIS